MTRRFKFDVGEIEFVAANLDCHTRHYIVAARRAAMARARRRWWPDEARDRMRRAASAMKKALDEWPIGQFDSSMPNTDK